MKTPAWLVYERCVAAIVADKYGQGEVVVQANAIIVGAISGKERQVDVLVDARYPDVSKDRLIVDAKHRRAKVDINDIESFEGMMKDCSANRGVIVCTAGFTKGAERRAQDSITISLMSLEEAVEFEWLLDPCLGECFVRSGRHRGKVLWGPSITPVVPGQPFLVSRIGKCDGCHQFHVWCDSCGKRFIVPDATTVDCDCGSWVSVPEASECEEDGRPESIWLLFQLSDDVFVMDRRPIHSPWTDSEYAAH